MIRRLVRAAAAALGVGIVLVTIASVEAMPAHLPILLVLCAVVFAAGFRRLTILERTRDR